MRSLLAFVFFLGLVAPAFGQSNYAMVTGTVTDSQFLPVTGATVHLKALSTGAVRVLTTNDSGLFSAPALPPDDYELTTESTGFAVMKQYLHLEVGEKLAVEVELKIGAVKEGDPVKRGQVIGLSGGTGRATGPHLHVAVRWQGTALDPAALIRLRLP